jgi:hypothetical protein
VAVASELPSPFEPAVPDAAWHVMGVEIWFERLRRRMRRPEHAGVEERLIQGVHESLYLRQRADDEQTTEQADRRLRDAYNEAAAAVGLEPSPW